LWWFSFLALESDNLEFDEKMLFISLLDLRTTEIGSEGRARLARGSPFSTISLMSTSFTEHSFVAVERPACFRRASSVESSSSSSLKT
jgi:hypothetical protein